MIDNLPEPVLGRLRFLLRPADIIALDTVCPAVHRTFAPIASVAADILREWEKIRENTRLANLENEFANTFLNRSYRSSNSHLPLHAPEIDR